MNATMTAGELRVGDHVAERDGYLLEVRAIVKETPKTVTFLLGSNLSTTLDRAGSLVTVRKASKVVVVRV